MAQTSPVLALPFIQAAQAQKHVTHNEALLILDAIVQLAVADWLEPVPPATAEAGARYIVPVGGQQAWSGHDTKVAVLMDGYWFFVTPQAGWTAQVLSGGVKVMFDGSAWIEAGFENLEGVGINTTSDSTNRLSVSGDATLLNHAGTGHQLKLNKNSAADTASLLFQTSFSGRAEMGTSGTDDFAIKVSGDGSTWATALLVDGQTGAVALPSTPLRRVLTAPLTLYVDPVLGDDSSSGEGVGTSAFETLSHAVDVAMDVDGHGFPVVIQLADGTHTLSSTIIINHRTIGYPGIIFRGNLTDPLQVTVTGPLELFEVNCGRIFLEGIQLQNTSSSAPVLMVNEEGFCSFENIDFGTAGGHISIIRGSISVTGSYTISGSASFHMRLLYGGLLRTVNATVTLSGVLNFSAGFITILSACVVKMIGTQFIGTATGRRFLSSYNSVLDTSGGGANFFPGDQAGSAANFSIYR